MALSSSILTNKLYDKVEEKFTKLPRAAREVTRRFLEACAEALIDFLNENVTVQVNVTVTVNQAGLQQYTQTITGPTGIPTTTTSSTLAPVGSVTLTGTGTGKLS